MLECVCVCVCVCGAPVVRMGQLSWRNVAGPPTFPPTPTYGPAHTHACPFKPPPTHISTWDVSTSKKKYLLNSFAVTNSQP